MPKQYLALLRGINVGGKNPMKMSELREALQADAFANVDTYIQSGNVLFETELARGKIEAAVERVIERAFGYSLVVVVRSRIQLRSVIDAAPNGFGAAPDKYHSDVVFLKSPLTADQAMSVVETRDGVDNAWPGRAVVYFQRLSEKRTQSRMGKIIGTAEYASMTIRSWKTTTKLFAMLEAR